MYYYDFLCFLISAPRGGERGRSDRIDLTGDSSEPATKEVRWGGRVLHDFVKKQATLWPSVDYEINNGHVWITISGLFFGLFFGS